MKLGLTLKKSIVLATAMIASASALATPLVGAVVSGYATGYTPTSSTTFTSTVYPTGLTGATLDTLLLGSKASPTGNIELGLLGSTPTTTLTGMYGSAIVTISSLTAADWTSALATSYITAAAKSIGATLSATQLSTAVSTFFTLQAWRKVSDPNIAYVDFTDGEMALGLAGYYDATPILNALFGGAPAGSQASEVVKVSVNGGPAEYLYSFTASQSGLTNAAGSFTGTYEVTKAIPEPSSIALLGLGLAGLVAMRRRKAK